jgi:flagellar biosynthesis/type III secretory pathway M-ring protein FliF/YscJ
VSMDHHEDTMGEITMIADRRPEDVANVLRTWLAETTPRRS